ncbi:surface-adhesin E family protein [Polynucleobacter sp. JS-Polo-80-F4]|uniref:surface-adhesin E family protein n=1 Tax=Polynucleobacter sp. JS-Polo-80-F4 TaxID=2576918 RepID=UPI001C0D4FF6|nr:surface-adhesin E family protein [Polynucleobacter sp. JS-Polo-80-F4]MBU3617328.1 hypothetical protein [Polynucleobacter sp. JS-Polo-80-F4]
MKKFIIFSAIALSSLSCFAQSSWQLIGQTDKSTAYIDTNSIKKIGGNTRVWTMFDYKQPLVNGYFTANSYIEYMEFDCKDERLKTLKQVLYSGNKGSGEFSEIDLTNEKWSFVTPSTINHFIMKNACKRK